jgi:hypothetical protein
MFDPKFQTDTAIYIIWARPSRGQMYTLAAGGLTAMQAAWEVVQAESPDAELTLQFRARVLKHRPPLIG